jgi:hypothetical protein
MDIFIKNKIPAEFAYLCSISQKNQPVSASSARNHKADKQTICVL